MDRVKYFRDRSARNRAREEKEILETEMTRTTRSFSTMKFAWTEMGRQENENHAFARSAYAYKQAEMYARLANDSKMLEDKVDQKRLAYQQWYELAIMPPWKNQ